MIIEEIIESIIEIKERLDIDYSARDVTINETQRAQLEEEIDTLLNKLVDDNVRISWTHPNTGVMQASVLLLYGAYRAENTDVNGLNIRKLKEFYENPENRGPAMDAAVLILEKKIKVPELNISDGKKFISKKAETIDYVFRNYEGLNQNNLLSNNLNP